MLYTQYAPGQIPPEMFPGNQHYYIAYCENGAAAVLSQHVLPWFNDVTGEGDDFFINFSNFTFADLPQHTILQTAMENLHQQGLRLEVFTGLCNPTWMPWEPTNMPNNLRIEGIVIHRNEIARNTKISNYLKYLQQKLMQCKKRLLNLHPENAKLSDIDKLLTRYTSEILPIAPNYTGSFLLYSKWITDVKLLCDATEKISPPPKKPPITKSWGSKILNLFLLKKPLQPQGQIE